MLRRVIEVEWPVDLAVAFSGWTLVALMVAHRPPAEALVWGIVGTFYYLTCWPMVKLATDVFSGGGCLVILSVFSWPLAIAVMIVFGILYHAVRLLSRQIALPLLRSLADMP